MDSGRAALVGLVALTAVSLGVARAARAENPTEAGDLAAPLPLAANFSVAERAVIVTVDVAGVLALVVAPRLLQPDAPRLGTPPVGGLDRRLSDALYPGPDAHGRFLAGVPDVAGLYVIPYLPALFYAGEAAWQQPGGAATPAGRPRAPAHQLWAYAEALGWTALLTGLTKVTVGRARPYLVLDHPERAGARREDNLSFFSSHASASFCAATFAALDVSDTLRRGPLRTTGPVRRALLGVVAPWALAMGVAGVVGVSRVVDQQHWASDVLVGAVIGSASATLAYLGHFDGEGHPRHRLGTDSLAPPGRLGLVPLPGGVALAGLLP